LVRDFFLPQLSMGMSEGTIVEWLVEEGAYVEKDAQLLNLETEKVLSELPAPFAGFLHIEVPQDQTVPVNTLLARFADTIEQYQRLRAPQANPQSGAATLPPAAASPLGAAPSQTPDQPKRRGKPVASGLARNIAREQGVSLDGVAGSGPGGRILRRDVLAVVNQASEAPVSAPAQGPGVERRLLKRIPLTGMRGQIAERMVAANTLAASTHLFFEIDVTLLLETRNTLIPRESEFTARVSMTALYVRALTLALESVPICNSTLADNEISVWEDVNVGIAVALPGPHDIDSGLVVPVVRQANRKSLRPLDQEIRDLIARARARKLTAEDLAGATVTLASTAGFFPDGWMVSAPILNLPQVASFQPGSVLRKPMVHGDQIVARDVLPCALTIDHRALDGEPAARLAKRLAQILSTPGLLFSQSGARHCDPPRG
jgi:pyruvate dehydrogenase E2 component (dihydrolipoyllysine-residue acetyltransferase)